MEKIIKPIINQLSDCSPKQSAAKATNTQTIKLNKVDQADNNSGIEPEKKNPNHVDHNTAKIFDRVKFRDGGFRQYTVDGPVSENPLFQEVRKTLGMDDSGAMQHQNDIAQIIEMVCTWLQDDDPFEVSRFIRYQLRRTPQGGDRTYNLIRNLQIMYLDPDD